MFAAGHEICKNTCNYLDVAFLQMVTLLAETIALGREWHIYDIKLSIVGVELVELTSPSGIRLYCCCCSVELVSVLMLFQ